MAAHPRRTDPLRTISVCSGIGGIDLALRACGVARTVCYLEREAFSAATLVAAARKGLLDDAPIWSDATSFAASEWVEAVDLVAAGIPCQPHSVAGLRSGLSDERDLTQTLAHIVRHSNAPLVFVENVAGYLRSGAPRLLYALSELGFDAEWSTLKASDVGAPHRRDRIFILAYRRADGLQLLRQALDNYRRHASGHEPDGCGSPLGHGDGQGSPLDGDRRHLQFQQPPALRAGWPPLPDDLDAWAERIRAGGAEPGVRGGAHGIPERVDRIRALGNGVVPQQVAAAFIGLAARCVDAQT